MRLFGTMLKTSVQADRQGPSMTTRSPESRTSSNRSRNGPTSPPGLERMRTSARSGVAKAASTVMVATRVRNARKRSSVPSLAAQRRQPDAGGIKRAIDRKDWPGEVTGAIAAQEEDGLGQLLFKAVAVERDSIVIIGADLWRVHGLGHRG